jgi:CDP-glycerol:poly(glycerophosphate) glycerophosphotransferase
MIDAYARRTHYADHIAPIWRALADRGTFSGTPEVVQHLAAVGIDAVPAATPQGSGPIIVAGYRDARAVHGRDIVLVEHGAGQTYSETENGSYAGGRGRGGVRLFICPSERVADRNLERYPAARAVAVGCPKMDRWHSGDRRPSGGAVAIAFHWNATILPETTSAFRHYRRGLRELANSFDHVIGHGHPRIFSALVPEYERAGIEPVERFDEVLERADVFAVDNSSTLYEFASTDRPVVVLNAPWFRRDVEHGLRFWEMADVGIGVEGPDDLVAGISRALEDPPEVADRRRQIVAEVYAACDGNASRRAADAIAELGGGRWDGT